MPGEPPGSSDPLDPDGLVGRAAEAAAGFADGSLLGIPAASPGSLFAHRLDDLKFTCNFAAYRFNKHSFTKRPCQHGTACARLGRAGR